MNLLHKKKQWKEERDLRQRVKWKPCKWSKRDRFWRRVSTTTAFPFSFGLTINTSTILNTRNYI